MTSTVLHRALRITGIVALTVATSVLAGCSGDDSSAAAPTTSNTPLPKASIAADASVSVRGKVTDVISPYVVKIDAENSDGPVTVLLPSGKTTLGKVVEKGQELTVKGPVLKVDAGSGANYGLPPNAVGDLKQVNGQLVVSGAFVK
jgi:uncharacterized lipoprotein YajG